MDNTDLKRILREEPAKEQRGLQYLDDVLDAIEALERERDELAFQYNLHHMGSDKERWNAALEEAAKVAEERANISYEAAGFEATTAIASQTERCAMHEAMHISRLIRNLKR